MPDWDEESPKLHANLVLALRAARSAARRRDPPQVETARPWHSQVMDGLVLQDRRPAGGFRGERDLEDYEVRVGPHLGVPASDVAEALVPFEAKLRSAVAHLDGLIAPGTPPGVPTFDAVLDAMAWAHAEWVRIHPFANGNGRTARLWANAIAMRYGLPPFVRLRPRPRHGYDAACVRAMQGDWKPTSRVFRTLFDRFADESGADV